MAGATESMSRVRGIENGFECGRIDDSRRGIPRCPRGARDRARAVGAGWRISDSAVWIDSKWFFVRHRRAAAGQSDIPRRQKSLASSAAPPSRRPTRRVAARGPASAPLRRAADCHPLSNCERHRSSTRNPLLRHVGEILRNSQSPWLRQRQPGRSRNKLDRYYATILYREPIAQILEDWRSRGGNCTC